MLGEEEIINAKKISNYHQKKSLLKHCYEFKNLYDFAYQIQKQGKWHDYVAINGVPFTMEEFDIDGQVMLWSNTKLNLTIEVTHENRYHDATSLKSIIVYPAHCWRNDITYLE